MIIWRLSPIFTEVVLIKKHLAWNIEVRWGRGPAEGPCSLEGVCIINISQIIKKKKKEWKKAQKLLLIASPISNLTEEYKKAICRSSCSGSKLYQTNSPTGQNYKLLGKYKQQLIEGAGELPKQAENGGNSMTFIKEVNHIRWCLFKRLFPWDHFAVCSAHSS